MNANANPSTGAADDPGHSGDINAAEFEQLAGRHRPRALRFCTAFLNHPAAAEDIVQEALKRLYERRAQYPLRTHFGPYLVKTMARLCVDQKRENDASPARQANLRARMDRSAEDPALRAETSDTHGMLTQAVRKLPERERACLLMIVCEGLSYKEAAEALQISFAEVNNAVHRARLQLKDTLGPLLNPAPRPASSSMEKGGGSWVQA